MGLQNNNSTGSLGAYTVPSQDGRLIPAIPIKLALKYTPMTIAVVYQMPHIKDKKSGKPKKYIHNFKITFGP